MKSEFKNIQQAINDLKQKKLIIVVDDEQRENEGDLVCTATGATPENINFMATYGKGLICCPIDLTIANRLALPLMVQHNTDPHLTAFTISIDHKDTTTGISAFDRALTIQQCAQSDTKPKDFRRPGHMFPLLAKSGGVLERPGHTEATVDLAKLATNQPCGACCEIMNNNGTMMRMLELVAFAKKHRLTLITIKELQNYLKFINQK